MKRLGFLLCALLTLVATPALYGAKRGTHPTQPTSGEVFITNHTGKHIVVKWQTSLSDNMQSRMHSSDVGPKAKKSMASSGVEWFKDDTQGMKNDQVYTILVEVYSEGEKALMSEKTFKKTISRKKLFGQVPEDNLYISVYSNYASGISIK